MKLLSSKLLNRIMDPKQEDLRGSIYPYHLNNSSKPRQKARSTCQSKKLASLSLSKPSSCSATGDDANAGCSFDPFYKSGTQNTVCGGFVGDCNDPEPGPNDACPIGYHLFTNDPNKLRARCRIDDSCNVVGPLQKNGTPYYKDACVPDHPVMGPADTDPHTIECCFDQIPQTASKAGTCDTGYCSCGSKCREAMKEYCLTNGYDPKGDGSGICRKFISTTSNGFTKKDITLALLDENYKVPGDAKGNPFNKNAVELCNLIEPGSCDVKLDEVCSGFTRKDLDEDDSLKSLCGCHLDPEVYNSYNAISLQGIVPKECDPLCEYPNTIRQGDGAGGERTCKVNVCVIDVSNIGAINSSINQSDFNINQICSNNSGGDSAAACYIALDTYDDFNNKVTESGIDINQQCGGNCYVFDPKDPEKKTKVDCSSSNGESLFSKILRFISEKKTSIIAGIAALIILFLLSRV
jgi:hypothetical protein